MNHHHLRTTHDNKASKQQQLQLSLSPELILSLESIPDLFVSSSILRPKCIYIYRNIYMCVFMCKVYALYETHVYVYMYTYMYMYTPGHASIGIIVQHIHARRKNMYVPSVPWFFSRQTASSRSWAKLNSFVTPICIY